MTGDAYLNNILICEAVDMGPTSPVWGVQAQLMTLIRKWAREQLNTVHSSGSFAKGTANRSGTDIDLFISLKHTTTDTLKEIYTKLGGRLREKGYTPRQQNVSWNKHCNASTNSPVRIIWLPEVRQSTRDLAWYVTRAVYESADGQPRRWRTLSTIPGATAASVLYAVEQGWLELEGAHSACLTEEGRRLMAKEAH